MDQNHIRNFAIIAHIDHGKSTLADRLMEITGTVDKRQMQAQLLDSNPIERERGITIKLAPVRMEYKRNKIKDERYKTENVSDILPLSSYILNLIDTPGHVDFTYEVSRSLAACEGALLVVDATQGVQAQTLANLAHARRNNLKIIPLVNKIDLPNARVSEAEAELVELGFKKEEIIPISAKTGQNVEAVLEAIVERIPPPSGKVDRPTRALIFSSQYDAHKGVVVFVRVVDGNISFQQSAIRNQQEVRNNQRGINAESRKLKADSLFFLASGAEVTPIEIGYFSPQMKPSAGLFTGEVGYIATGLKDVRLAKVGDTITVNSSQLTVHGKRDSVLPLSGYKEPKPMVFLSLFPINAEETEEAREAMERLRLSDSAFTFRPIYSQALGNGFHCGFLGLLHAEIVQERLSREFNLNMIATAPSVEYRIKLKGSKKSPAEVAKQNFDPSSVSSSASPLSKFQRESEAGQNFVSSPQVGGFISIQSAAEYPDPSLIEEVREPIMQMTIYTPSRYVGAVMGLSQEKRGVFVDQVYHLDQVEFTYLIPLSEMIVDFFDRLKSVSEGYASLDYEFYDYQSVNLAKIDILVNKEKVDALSFFAVENSSQRMARAIVERLADVIPRGQFEIPIQAAIGGQVIARSDVKSFRKDVIAKLYGGDRSRKDKLLDKQKKGKAKMKMVGKVEIPQSAFFEVLKQD